MHRVLAALLLTQGCAFGIDGPDPNRPRSELPKCDTGKGAVVLDGAMATVAGIIALTLASEDETAVALVPLSIGALYAAGAVKGNNAANRCREANADFEAYLAARDTLEHDTPRAPEPRPLARPPQPAPAVAASPPAPPLAPAPAPAGVAAPSPPSQPPAQPAASSEPEPDDEWSAFWREVE